MSFILHSFNMLVLMTGETNGVSLNVERLTGHQELREACVVVVRNLLALQSFVDHDADVLKLVLVNDLVLCQIEGAFALLIVGS